METDTATLMLRSIPPRLKGKIAKRVEREQTNMNDVLVAILADEFLIPFEGTGARRLKVGLSEQINLKVPIALKEALEEEAHAQRNTERNIAVEIISAEFGVPFKATGRWLEKRAAA